MAHGTSMKMGNVGLTKDIADAVNGLSFSLFSFHGEKKMERNYKMGKIQDKTFQWNSTRQ